MDSIGDRIRLCRKRLGISQAELAETVGYGTRSTIAKIEAGKIDPYHSKIVALAHALKTTPEYLIGWTTDDYNWDDDPDNRLDTIPNAILNELTEKHHGNSRLVWEDWQAMERGAAHEATKGKAVPKGFIPLPDTKAIPVIGNIACGTPILAQENIERYIGVSSLWKADFALVCKGDSMSPTIQDGDLVCIRSQPNVENGQIAAVLIDDEATLKHFYRHDDTVILQPENPRFTPMTYTKEEINDLRIEGVAVGICRGLPDYGPEGI